MKEFWRNYISHLFLVASAISILVILAHIAIYGSCTVYEHKSWVLGLEIAWAVGTITLGSERVYSTLKRRFS